jgi:hypothetical protein
MPDGQRYPAEPRADKPAKDITVVAVKTGVNTDEVCHPVPVARDGYPEYTTDGHLKNPDESRLGVGYPRDASTPYASPGTVNGSGSLLNFTDSLYVRQESWSEPVVQNRANYTPGQSGGGVYNEPGELTGLMRRTSKEKHELSLETPVSKQEVENLLRKSRR